MNRGLHGRPVARATFPREAVLWPFAARVVKGAALFNGISNTYRHNAYTHQATAADGDTLEHTLALAAGTYALTIQSDSSTNRGKFDVYLDGAAIARGLDGYSGSFAYPVNHTVTFAVGANGQHTLRTVINGKHASSSDYYLVLVKMSIAPV